MKSFDLEMDEDYGDIQGGDFGVDDVEDTIYQEGNREDLDHQEGLIDGGDEKTELLMEGTGQAIDKSKRITTRYMTKYERARVLGTRALQIR